MSTYPPYGSGPGGPDSFGRRIDEVIERLQLELRQAAAYFNDAVIPQVRSESISALRTMSESLRKFADHLDEAGQRPQQPPRSPSS